MQQPGQAAVNAREFLGHPVSCFVAAHLLLQTEVLDHPRDHGPRLRLAPALLKNVECSHPAVSSRKRAMSQSSAMGLSL